MVSYKSNANIHDMTWRIMLHFVIHQNKLNELSFYNKVKKKYMNNYEYIISVSKNGVC